MPNETILHFTQKLLRELEIRSYVLKEPFAWDSTYDGGLRESILDVSNHLPEFWSDHLTYICNSSILSTISDSYHCEYIGIRLPDHPGLSILLIGPFTYEKMTAGRILEFCNAASIPLNLNHFMQQYYQALPFLADERWIKGLTRNLAESFWPDTEIQVRSYVENQKLEREYNSSYPVPPADVIQQLETRYENEGLVMKAIADGDLSTVEQLAENEKLPIITQRFSDSLRDKKNKLIILNTLCRKAAEHGHVHPVYLDEIFGKYTFEIERTTDIKQLSKLGRSMLRKYCLLVQSHSLNGYSQPIQQAINMISFNLTDDLSLSAIARKLMLNSSYLSTLFRKETGMTLTHFVNSKRVEHAIFLLNTTLLPIQEIAILCGIPDLNYFTKIFKKYQNMTPSGYREMLRGQ